MYTLVMGMASDDHVRKSVMNCWSLFLFQINIDIKNNNSDDDGNFGWNTELEMVLTVRGTEGCNVYDMGTIDWQFESGGISNCYP